jgi:hypothetical protein
VQIIRHVSSPFCCDKFSQLADLDAQCLDRGYNVGRLVAASFNFLKSLRQVRGEPHVEPHFVERGEQLAEQIDSRLALKSPLLDLDLDVRPDESNLLKVQLGQRLRQLPD